MNIKSDFSQYRDENCAIWDVNAEWWDDRIGDGNDFQTYLIEPATERLLAVQHGDVILDVACGAGRFARRMADIGAQVVAFDCSSQFINRAKERTPDSANIDYQIIDTSDTKAMLKLAERRYDKAVCTMALMDMPEVEPLMQTLPRLLKDDGIFVFSIIHPCFHSAAVEKYCEMGESEDGRLAVKTGVKVSKYITPFVQKTEGIIGQPTPQFVIHRPLQVILNVAFSNGFVMDGLEEPVFAPLENPVAGVGWRDMQEIPPIMVVRMRLRK